MLTQLRARIAEWLAPTARWFRSLPRIHRNLVAASAVTGALLAIAVIVVIGTWATGGFAPSLTSEADRNLAQAQDLLERAEDGAQSKGLDPENDPAVTAATANVVIALVDTGRIEDALSLADDLRPRAEGQARALYAVAYAYQQSELDGYTSQVADLYAQAAKAIGQDQSELGRAVLLGYGRVLVESGQLDLAADHLSRAAAIEPASAEIYLELAAVYERSEDWNGAAFAYASALAYDPLMVAADEGFNRIAESHPEEARRALESPDLPRGGGGGHL